jgi:DNA-binding LacI/PurR family transcriptional regulator
MAAKLKLAEIARRTGLSIGTVSRVLAGKANTSAHAKQLVLECARDEGVLENIATSRVLFNQVLIFAPARAYDARADVFYYHVVQGLKDAFRPHDTHLSFCSLEERDSDAQLFLKCLADPAVDATIILGNDDPKIHELANDLGKPTVLINCQDRAGKLDSVMPDHRQIGEITADQLLALGHRNILTMICLRRSTMERRLGGVRDAYSAFNLRYDEGRSLITTSGFSAEEAEQALDLFFQTRGADEIPTAIIASGNLMVEGVARALQKRNLRVAEDVSIISIDGLAQSVVDGFALCHCHVPREELAREALVLLQRRVAHHDAPVCNVLVCGRLESGNSAVRFAGNKPRPAVATHSHSLFYGR